MNCNESHALRLSLHWLGGVTVRVSNLRSRDRGFHFRSGHYQVVTTLMGDCLQCGSVNCYITNTKVNSAFHPSRVGKSSIPAYLAGVMARRVYLCQVAGNTVWFHVAGDTSWLWPGFPHKCYTI